MRKATLLASLCSILVLAVLGGCASKIQGETNTPPPAGGPGDSSAHHPPGLTNDELNKVNAGK